MKATFPFSVFKRANRHYYVVAFKDELTGKYSNPISTRQTSQKEAIKTAWTWYHNGIPHKDDNTQSVQSHLLLDSVRKTDLTQKDVESLIQILKKQGLVKSAVLSGTRQDIDVIEYLQNFWDFDNSPYVQEKSRKLHSIHRRYCLTNLQYVKNHWSKIFTGHVLADISRQEIDSFMLHLGNSGMSASAINHCIKAGTVAFKWAYQKELIDKDIYSGYVFFSRENVERKILTPELAQALFAIEWENQHAKLACMLAMCTGMRAGEIQALRILDLGNDCLYVRHSWNDIDRLKVTKNKENRIVEVPFQNVMQGLIDLAKENPHGQKMDGFIFWGLLPDSPIDEKVFRKYLRRALVQIGMSELEAKTYTFHSWRHFFTTFMRDKVTDKLLQQQTGHKTHAMLEHYANHRIQTDKDRLQLAQREAFGDILQPVEYEVCSR